MTCDVCTQPNAGVHDYCGRRVCGRASCLKVARASEQTAEDIAAARSVTLNEAVAVVTGQSYAERLRGFGGNTSTRRFGRGRP